MAWKPVAGIHRGKVYNKEISDLIDKYGVKIVLDVIEISEIEKYLRKKKLDNIKK